MPPCTGDEHLITASDRDGYWTTAGFDNAGAFAQVSYFPANEQDSFFVFEPSLPPGATIISALLSLSSSTTNAGTLQTDVYGVLSPTPAIPLNRVDCEGAPLTAAINWTIGATVTGFWYQSPDLSAILQTLVNQPGYLVGSFIILQVRATAPTVTIKRWNTWDSNPNNAAILCVEYSFGREVYFKGMVRGKFRKMR